MSEQVVKVNNGRVSIPKKFEYIVEPYNGRYYVTCRIFPDGIALYSTELFEREAKEALEADNIFYFSRFDWIKCNKTKSNFRFTHKFLKGLEEVVFVEIGEDKEILGIRPKDIKKN